MILLKNIILEFDNSRSISSTVEKFESSINSKYSSVIKRFMIYYDQSTKSIFLSDIYIKPEFYGKGFGSKIMNDLITFADNNKLPITLIPENERGSDKKLIDFYKKFGFVVNQGNLKNKQLSIPDSISLYRLPKG